MTQLRGGEIIADYLEAERTPYLFGLCGHGNVGLLDTLLDRPGIKTVSVHHESAAGFMADAFYRVSGKPVVTLTSCGPGSLQLPVALATALMDASAFLAITGNVPTSQFNRGPFQESGYHFQADFPSAVRPFVKRSFQATRAEQLPLMLRQGFKTMTSGRPGPVHLDVPLDVFVESADVEVPDPAAWNWNLSGDTAVSAENLGRVIDALRTAQRPLILAGNQAMAASDLVARLSRTLGIPVAWTPDGKGVVDPREPLHLGETGRNGGLAANRATQAADLILAVTARFDDRATSSWLPGFTFSIPPTKLIQVEVDPADLARNFPVHLGIVAAPKTFLGQLLGQLDATGADGRLPGYAPWREEVAGFVREWQESRAAAVRPEAGGGPLDPVTVLAEARRAFPEDGILLADVGVHHNWIVQEWPAYRPGTLLQSWGFASMGFGLAGALGAKLARPEAPVLTVCGDGGFLMLPSVVATAVEYDIPAVWLVWNNQGFVSIRDIQRGYFGRGREYMTDFRTTSGDLYSADYAMMAQAMGAQGLRVDKPGQVGAAIEAAFASGRPTVIDVPVERDVAPVPTGSWDLPPLPHPVPAWMRE
jgi:acetolactate synthase-1/2/3 large subunit